MLREIRKFSDEGKKYAHFVYAEADFVGPEIGLLVEYPKEAPPVIEAIGKMKYDTPAVAIGINKLMANVAREFYSKFGPCSLKSKYGKIFVNAANYKYIMEEIAEKQADIQIF